MAEPRSPAAEADGGGEAGGGEARAGEPGGGGVFSPAEVVSLNRQYRCHGRWGGLLLGRDVSGAAEQQATLAAAAAMRTVGTGVHSNPNPNPSPNPNPNPSRYPSPEPGGPG